MTMCGYPFFMQDTEEWEQSFCFMQQNSMQCRCVPVVLCVPMCQPQKTCQCSNQPMPYKAPPKQREKSCNMCTMCDYKNCCPKAHKNCEE